MKRNNSFIKLLFLVFLCSEKVHAECQSLDESTLVKKQMQSVDRILSQLTQEKRVALSKMASEIKTQFNEQEEKKKQFIEINKLFLSGFDRESQEFKELLNIAYNIQYLLGENKNPKTYTLSLGKTIDEIRVLFFDYVEDSKTLNEEEKEKYYQTAGYYYWSKFYKPASKETIHFLEQVSYTMRSASRSAGEREGVLTKVLMANLTDQPGFYQMGALSSKPKALFEGKVFAVDKLIISVDMTNGFERPDFAPLIEACLFDPKKLGETCEEIVPYSQLKSTCVSH